VSDDKPPTQEVITGTKHNTAIVMTRFTFP
jgi:hypothetical protein